MDSEADIWLQMMQQILGIVNRKFCDIEEDYQVIVAMQGIKGY